MRIAIFIKSTTFHKNYGGLETLNKVLAEGLAGRGHSVTVFSPKRELSYENKTENGVSYKFIPCSYKYLFSELDKNSWFNKSYTDFKLQHEEKPFDIVIGQSSAAIGIIRHKKALNVKVIPISHGSILSEYKTAIKQISGIKDLVKLGLNTQYVLRAYFGSQREFIRHSNKVVAVSSAVRKSIIEEAFIPEEKAEVILNGIDPTIFEKYEKKSTGMVNIVFAGRVIVTKGIIDLIETIKDPEFISTNLNIIGEGDQLNTVRDLAEKYEISSRVHIYGQIKHEEVISMLFENDIFVLPSLRVEGLPMTLIEALFAGLPIVASDIGGISSAVLDHETGFLIKPGNRECLKKALLTLVHDKDLCAKFSYNAKAFAQKEFTLNSMLDKYEDLIRRVLL